MLYHDRDTEPEVHRTGLQLRCESMVLFHQSMLSIFFQNEFPSSELPK